MQRRTHPEDGTAARAATHTAVVSKRSLCDGGLTNDSYDIPL